MIDLYTWGTPNGRKVSVMLEECGLPYRVHPINIGKDEQFKPEFLAINPNNRIPAIVDPEGPDGKPLKLFESGAILDLPRRPRPATVPARTDRGKYVALQWLMFQMGGVGPMFGQAHHFMRATKEQMPYGDRALRQGDEAALRRARQAPRRGRVPRRTSTRSPTSPPIPGSRATSGTASTSPSFPHVKRWYDTIARAPGGRARHGGARSPERRRPRSERRLRHRLA